MSNLNIDKNESFHPYLKKENEILNLPLEKIQNLIFYGNRGIGKYHQVLLYIKKCNRL